jgi:hypothetical protein
LVLKLDLKTRTVALLAQYTHGENYDAAYMGDIQLLPNGNVLVGWGSEPDVSEYTKSGQLLLDASFPSPDLSYRATVANWVGLPRDGPSGAARPNRGGTTVFASWNGATEVTSWKVLAGTSNKRLSVVASAPKTGFETQVNVKGNFTTFEVQALNSKGHVIGVSRPFVAAQS